MNGYRNLDGKKIIIAEDDENSFFLLEHILSEFNPWIIHTETGEETLQAFMDNQDACLILMDIRMPGTNGLETARKIREFNHEVPIIVQTALVFKDEEERIFEAGCNDYILKPIEQDKLMQKIDEWVTGRFISG